jgi:hypothetical protein
MGKIGAYEFPDISLNEAVKIVRIIFDKPFSGEVRDVETLATRLGHETTKSGGFFGKITALKRYGLISGDPKSGLRLTELGTRIAKPMTPEEEQRCMAEVVSNIELFKRIYERIEEKVKKEDFWTVLVEITGVERSIALKQADKIHNLYIEAAKYLKLIEMERKPPIIGVEKPLEPSVTFETLRLTIPLREIKDFDYAISTLDFLKRNLESRVKAERKGS